jgi:hypothetical protein
LAFAKNKYLKLFFKIKRNDIPTVYFFEACTDRLQKSEKFPKTKKQKA